MKTLLHKGDGNRAATSRATTMNALLEDATARLNSTGPPEISAALGELMMLGFRCCQLSLQEQAPAGFAWLVLEDAEVPSGGPLGVVALTLGSRPSSIPLDALAAAAVRTRETGTRKDGRRSGLLLLWGTQDAMLVEAARWQAWMAQVGERITYCVAHAAEGQGAWPQAICYGAHGMFRGELTIVGVQGHVAYPHLADNPIHRGMPAVVDLCEEAWDLDEAGFSAAHFQIEGIRVDTNSHNVIPGVMVLDFSFCHAMAAAPESLLQRMEVLLTRRGLNYRLHRHAGIPPFSCEPAGLAVMVSKTLLDVTGGSPALSTVRYPSCWNILAGACREFVGLDCALDGREMRQGDSGAWTSLYWGLIRGMDSLPCP